MELRKLNNVVQTYLAKEKARGLSAQAAIKAACEATGRRYNDKYLSAWPSQKTTVPDDVCRWMQMESAHFAAQMVGAKLSKAKALELAEALAVPIKITDK